MRMRMNRWTQIKISSSIGSQVADHILHFLTSHSVWSRVKHSLDAERFQSFQTLKAWLTIAHAKRIETNNKQIRSFCSSDGSVL
jgi:hypothetical protein